jgi:chain length determinant protein (polysaccharide antigen chain regulator)
LQYPGVSQISSDDIYERLGMTLLRKDILERLILKPEFKDYFFSNENDINDVVSNMKKKLMVQLPEKGKKVMLIEEDPMIEISFTGKDPHIAYQFTKEFLKTVELETQDRILTAKKEELKSLLQNNEQLFKLENTRINDENISAISRLNEEFTKAKLLGIETPVNPLEYAKTNNAVTKLDLSTQNPQGYWLGTKVLKAEMDMLKTRKSNIPFSQVLRDLLSQNTRYNEALAHLKAAKFDVFHVINSPRLPSAPVKSKTALILAVAGVLGLMLGVFIALIRRAVKNRRQVESSVA